MRGKSAKKQPASKADHLKKYRWPKGVSGNPAGRPEGTLSPITRIRQMFTENPDDFDDFLEAYLRDKNNRRHAIEMLDGKPREQVDVTTAGKELPQPLLYALRHHDSDGENSKTGEADTRNPGGDIGE